MLVIGESCPRPRFRVAESSIHTFRILLITVESSVVYADTSKNEATWYKVLLHLRCKIIFNPKSIRGMVTWTAFYINRNSSDNLYVRYLYFNEVSQTWNSNYYNVRNKFNSNNPAAVAGNSLFRAVLQSARSTRPAFFPLRRSLAILRDTFYCLAIWFPRES